jgi:hypothetical protein
MSIVVIDNEISRCLSYTPREIGMDDTLHFWRPHADDFKTLLPIAR